YECYRRQEGVTGGGTAPSYPLFHSGLELLGTTFLLSRFWSRTVSLSLSPITSSTASETHLRSPSPIYFAAQGRGSLLSPFL
ncbi:hypothetical protein U1Q18_036539, partial [Sarracenia purpurea var. burkii]